MRVNKGPEEAQPEWPAAASATGAVPAAEDDGGGDAGEDAQTFPETGTGRALRVEDPWEEPGHDGSDPGELTVRLDRVEGSPDDTGTSRDPDGREDGGSEGPVFVDASGRRSRRFRRFGMAVGLACAVYAVVIVVTLLSGNSDAPWLPVPGQADDRPAGKVDTSPVPSEPVRPPGTGGGVAVPGVPGVSGVPNVPGISASASGSGKPSAGPGATAPQSSAGPLRPGASASPGPSGTASGGPKPPGAGGSTGPVVGPTPPSASTSPDPTPSGSGGASSSDPSPSSGGGGGGSTSGSGPGSGTVAEGPGSPVPVTSEPAPGTSGGPGPTTAPGPTSAPGPAGTSGASGDASAPASTGNLA
ncbi:translation initiation factor IF-2 [Streptomyces sp. MK5]|uniref:translation initiation factor IF-2 n=1 Tax=Streptomyces sp. MK5 TaxID=3064253 RepID=UPI002741C4B2|nr:translation initiation factor IF-2 [Streptomyces sp. MK5]